MDRANSIVVSCIAPCGLFCNGRCRASIDFRTSFTKSGHHSNGMGRSGFGSRPHIPEVDKVCASCRVKDVNYWVMMPRAVTFEVVCRNAERCDCTAHVDLRPNFGGRIEILGLEDVTIILGYVIRGLVGRGRGRTLPQQGNYPDFV